MIVAFLALRAYAVTNRSVLLAASMGSLSLANLVLNIVCYVLLPSLAHLHDFMLSGLGLPKYLAIYLAPSTVRFCPASRSKLSGERPVA